METILKYSIHSLLTETKGGGITGAMSPVLFAKEMAKQMDMKFNRLARIWIDNEEINQVYEGDGLTCHDTLIIGTKYHDDLWLSIWVDSGIGGVPVAMSYQSDKEIFMTPVYQKTEYAKKLTVEDVRKIFEYIYTHPESIAIKQESK